MKVLLLAFFILTAQAVSADGIADVWEDVRLLPLAAAPLTPDMAQSLYGFGHIPRVEDTDRFYDAGHTTGPCKASWDAMRRPHPPIRPVSAKVTLGQLEENARNAHLPLAKLHRALGVYLANQASIPDQEYISVVDFDKSANQNRWFFINLMTGKITAQRVSAGIGSDPGHSGNASLFSNTDGTYASSLGCAIVSGHVSSSKHGPSMLVHGLETTNNRSCSRAIEVHAPLKWAGRRVGFVKSYDAGNGRSDGCLAVNNRDATFKKLGRGGLVCSYKDGEHGVATHIYDHTGRRYSSYKRSRRKTYHYRHRRRHVHHYSND